MMNHQYQVTTFRAAQQQRLRNVRIHSPSLIQIQSGSKKLFHKEEAINLSSTSLLLCEASASLSFENLPEHGYFSSRLFSFTYRPTEAMLALSASHDRPVMWPVISTSPSLKSSLNALASFDLSLISQETQAYLLMVLYQQLAEQGVLHWLFESNSLPFEQKLRNYLAQLPEEEHPLERVATHFAMSRATLIRRLKQHGTRYREVLAEVRVNHALNLMQSGQRNIAILAQCCGYQSEQRFNQRFRSQFGLSPKAYLQTLGMRGKGTPDKETKKQPILSNEPF
ncbi:helix-turn-helix transcriptional regulator [Vibrio anguillarum]|nr:helix-turn-helix transcriptional regulator [Vibrio anguillarum]NNN97394.1 helix-turn-helix transcriptional regulator [Vibrio sp. B4-6]